MELKWDTRGSGAVAKLAGPVWSPGFMARRYLVAWLAFALSFNLPPAHAAGKRAPALDDGNGAFATQQYQNPFLRAGHSKAEMDAKV